MRLVDVRAGRFEQAGVVVVLLAGFVFRQPWSIPIATLVAAVGAVMGARSPITRLWNEVIAPRRRAGITFEPAVIARTQSQLLAAGLLLADLLLLAGSVALASIVAAVVAMVAALGATGIVSAAAELHRRANRD